MGLDMYLIGKVSDKDEEGTVLHSWRKHNALHGWMESLYVANGGNGQFNCVDLELTRVDIDQLEKDILAHNLPGTTGFFFGLDSREQDWRADDDLLAIRKAKSSLAFGNKVYYNSWW